MIRSVRGPVRSVSSSRLFSTSAPRGASLGAVRLPQVRNEDFRHYAPGSAERAALQSACERLRQTAADVPLVINGQEIRTGHLAQQVMPTDHAHVLATYHETTPELVNSAIEGAIRAQAQWEALPFEDRASIFLKAADLVSTKYRAELCAAVMLGTAKNVWQAEIDAAVEIIDFWRFNAFYAQEIYEMQPIANSPYVWNRMEYRALEGFVAAISPFNFIAIGSNLCCSPAQMGNVIVWKPVETTILGSYLVYKILEEAGLPPGVIQFVPGSPLVVGPKLIHSPHLAGLHFTGSTATFRHLYKEIAENLPKYKSYPRIVGETGGKNFHFVHESAAHDLESVANHTIRGAFEYQGQKCSATSRLYVPDTLWPKLKQLLVERVAEIKVGQPDDFSVFMCAVINEKSFDKLAGYIEGAKKSPSCEIIAGGSYDKSKGYFVQPTIILTKDPNYVTLKEELFGPVLTVYVYPHKDYESALKLCDSTAPYGLTGSLFCRDRYALELGNRLLRNTAGNFYVNDKSTGSLVGQQPFGGARASGTNDKSGSLLGMLRWVSARSIKESMVPLTTIKYPHMQ